jgi:hypothetical protein
MTILKRARATAWPAGKLNLSIMSAAFLIFGLSLIFQPSRWGSTPAYHVLLLIFRAQVWGVMFLLSGAAMALAVLQFTRRRWLVITSLTVAFTLTTGWALAFVARYLSSPNTTPETWVSWIVFDLLLLSVALTVDRPSLPPDGKSQEISDYRQAVDDALTDAAADQKATLGRALDSESEKLRDAVSAACAAYGQALHAIVPAGAMPKGEDPAKQALYEARNALLRAEEAYARATGQPAATQDPP